MNLTLEQTRQKLGEYDPPPTDYVLHALRRFTETLKLVPPGDGQLLELGCDNHFSLLLQHAKEFMPAEIKTMLKGSGFAIEQLTTRYGLYPKQTLGWADWLLVGLMVLWYPLSGRHPKLLRHRGEYIFAVARKSGPVSDRHPAGDLFVKILVLTPEVPYPPHYGGVPLKMYHLLTRLHDRHEFAVLCFTTGPEEQPAVEKMRPYCRKLVALPVPSAPAGRCERYWRPRDEWLMRSADMDRLIRDEVAQEQFDLVHIDLRRMARYQPLVRHIPKLMAAHDAGTLAYRSAVECATSGTDRLKMRWGLHLVERFERQTYPRFDACKVNTELDAAAVRVLCPGLPIWALPNGVDVDFYTPDYEREQDGEIVLTGTLDFVPNIDAATHFVRAIFPRVREQLPSARFTIIGRNPIPEVLALGQREGVEVAGYLPDLRGRVQAASVYVCPVRQGAGIKNKLLEALAMGKAVVATPMSITGLQVADGQQLLLRGDDQSFADAVVALLRDRQLRRRLGTAARDYVVQHHSWQRWAESMEEFYWRTVELHRYSHPL